MKKALARDAALAKPQLHHPPDDLEKPSEVAIASGDEQKLLWIASVSLGCPLNGVLLLCQLVRPPCYNRLSKNQAQAAPSFSITCP